MPSAETRWVLPTPGGPRKTIVKSIDDHVFFLIGYSVQGNLLSFLVGGEHIVQGDDCHIFADVFRWHGILITAV